MNFAQAVKGHKAKIKISIWSQAETELGRKPTPEEKKLALTNTSQERLLEEIEKVIFYTNMFVIYLFSFQFGFGRLNFQIFTQRWQLPCVVSFNPTQRDGNCLIHGKVLNTDQI
jgi:hypothetical protein